MGILDNLGDKLKGHEDQIDDVIEKAGDLIDDKTDDKFKGQVDQGQSFLKDQADKLGNS